MKKQNPPTVRFWTFHRMHWTRITLRPGQTLRHSFSYDNGEGHTRESVSFHYDADSRQVIQDYFETGRDCDGRSSSRWIGVCPLDRLQAKPAHKDSQSHMHNGTRIMRPEWERASAEQRDEYAELAGY